MLSADVELCTRTEKQQLKFQTTDSWNDLRGSGVNRTEQNALPQFLQILKVPCPSQLSSTSHYGCPQTHGQSFSPSAAFPPLQATRSSHKSYLKEVLRSLHLNSSGKLTFCPRPWHPAKADLESLQRGLMNTQNFKPDANVCLSVTPRYAK